MHPDVISEVERRRVDPQGPAKPPPGPVQQLTDMGDVLQSRFEPAADGLDPDAAVRVQQTVAIEDRKSADVRSPAQVVPQQQEAVRRGQAFQAGCIFHSHVPVPS